MDRKKGFRIIPPRPSQTPFFASTFLKAFPLSMLDTYMRANKSYSSSRWAYIHQLRVHEYLVFFFILLFFQICRFFRRSSKAPAMSKFFECLTIWVKSILGEKNFRLKRLVTPAKSPCETRLWPFQRSAIVYFTAIQIFVQYST